MTTSGSQRDATAKNSANCRCNCDDAVRSRKRPRWTCELRKTIAIIPRTREKRPRCFGFCQSRKAIAMNRPRKRSRPAASSRERPRGTAAYRNCDRDTTRELAKKQVRDISLSRKSENMKPANSRKRARQTCWLAKATAMHTANSRKSDRDEATSCKMQL